MKRNNLTTALIAGIAGVAGIASVSTAVNLNSDGVGQVLLYPYYTVNGGNNTLISVVNTTDNVKAVKVRFLEGKNSRECLDFNLYLSPYDVWTAALVPTTSTVGGHVGEESVKIITSDNSCLAPNTVMAGQEFLPYGYSNPAPYDELGLDMKRCTEGHFEMIEMGNVFNTASNGNAASAVTHAASGVPANCSVVHNNWLGGAWAANPADGIDSVLDGSGGLFGSAAIVNVPAGTEVSYNADAIQAYSTVPQHSNPGDLFPNVASGNNITSNIFYNGVVVTDTWSSDEVQAVSAVYMHDHIYGEFEITDAFGADTEWVVTFPTKIFYADPFYSLAFLGLAPPVEPFTRGLSYPAAGGPPSGPACEPFAMQRWDREEQQLGGGVLLPSPLPPGEQGPVFCWETNVLEFHDDNDVFGDSLILGSQNNMFVRPGFNNGWAEIAFTQNTNDNVAARTYTGLPVTGFAVQKYVNGTLGGGTTLANYAGLFAHRYSKNIQ